MQEAIGAIERLLIRIKSVKHRGVYKQGNIGDCVNSAGTTSPRWVDKQGRDRRPGLQL